MTAQAGDTTDSKRDRAQLRQHARAARHRLSPGVRRRAAECAAHHAQNLCRRLRARRVATYMAYASELSTEPLLNALMRERRTIHLPVIGREGAMCFRRWHGGALRRGAHGIARPAAGPAVFRSSLDVVFLPLLGFDARGTRLGAGGGYYDRWLATHKGQRPLLCGYAYSVQEFTELPRAAWDIPVDAIITERGFRRFSHASNE